MLEQDIGASVADTVRNIRVAIVNRGEAATRALQSLAEFSEEDGIKCHTIALYTDPDREALFVRRADEAYCLGPATYLDQETGRTKHTYLDQARLKVALLAVAPDAVWVGWGFVSEDAEFALLCKDLGIRFIGPTPEAMRLLGDKIKAKAIAEKAGVPVVPWSRGPVNSIEEAHQHAERIGYPLLVKATAGGGGRGIREVHDSESLERMYADARREAELGFGDPTVFMEKRVGAARHLEVQVLADTYGTIWLLGVRECTLQRRRQKVLEESGLAIPNADVERRLKEHAHAICKAVGYTNAGTVEFLYEPETDQVYFMEVNARLQVEHTVTEMVTRTDLVRHQLQIAFGARLPSHEPRSEGHSIEVRLNAEDPDRDFSPAPGHIALMRLPSGPGIRVDSGASEDNRIPTEFDSMIAKIIVWAPDRQAALRRLYRALLQTQVVVEGGATNKSFLMDLVRRPEVVAGAFSTTWLGEMLASNGSRQAPLADIALALAAIEVYEEERRIEAAHFWATAARGRPDLDVRNGREVELRHDGNTYSLHVLNLGSDQFRVTMAQQQALRLGVDRISRYERILNVGNQRYQALILSRDPALTIEVRGVSHRFLRNGGGTIRSHSPAVVVAVLVSPGDQVEAGAPMFVIESMKMESTICAPSPGRIREILARQGVQVKSGDVLARFDVTERVVGTDKANRIGFPASESQENRSVYDCAQSLVLGYDSEIRPEDLTRDLQNPLPAKEATAVEAVLADLGLIEIFCDVHALAPQMPPTASADGARPEDYLHSYLRQPDRVDDRLPKSFLEDLSAALARYGADAEHHTEPQDEALMRLFRSRRLAVPQERFILTILLRWRQNVRHLLPHVPARAKDLLDRLSRVTDTWSPTLSGLARTVRLRYFNQYMQEWGQASNLSTLQNQLERLAVIDEMQGATDERTKRIEQLIARPEHCRQWLLPWMRLIDRGLWSLALEVFVRIQYRHVSIERVHEADDGVLFVDTLQQGRAVSIVCAIGDDVELASLMDRVMRAYPSTETSKPLIVELVWLSHQECSEVFHKASAVGARLESRLGAISRVGITEVPPDNHGRFYTLRPDSDMLVTQSQPRNMHATTGERLELWRLSNFDTRTLHSSDEVHILACSSRDNPRDTRLFALAEVRDLSPVLDQEPSTAALCQLELVALKCLESLRHELGKGSSPKRYLSNRIVIYVEPIWTRPLAALKAVADRIAPMARGLYLEQVNLRLKLSSTDAPGTWSEVVVNIAIRSGSGVQLGIKPVSSHPIRPLSNHRARSAEMVRLGFTYPYDILQILTSPGVTHSDYPPGEFVEYDLDQELRLVPVQRPFGENSANVVVGLITNVTRKIPEGMPRVVILNDPSKSLGSLGEAECRRIVAALDLAESRSIPVEWYSVSSGARVSMESGTENLDWTARVLRRIVELSQRGHEINIVVTGINVGAQSYWNAEATMLMHSRGILIMIGESAMVLTGKQALDYSGGVSADNNAGIGGYDKIMGRNGEAQYWAPDIESACKLLFRYYDLAYVVAGESCPRRKATDDAVGRSICGSPHPALGGSDFSRVGEIFDAASNRERKKPFSIRAVMEAVGDTGAVPLERWAHMRDAETAVVWDLHIGGMPVSMIGIESHEQMRAGVAPADGPERWSSGTLFPRSSKKVASAINSASGSRPVVVLANLSGFDGSPESMRELQLEYGAEIGRAVVNFRGPLLFCVLSRYHGGAFVVFSRYLNDNMVVTAVEGAYASVLGGAPAAAVVFARDVQKLVDKHPDVIRLTQLTSESAELSPSSPRHLTEVTDRVRAEKRAELAKQFDAFHSIERARDVGSIDTIVKASELRAHIICLLEKPRFKAPERSRIPV